MKLIIGLGNPGKKYEKTRHNAGFLAVDFIKENIESFSNWKKNSKANALISISHPELASGPNVILSLSKDRFRNKFRMTNEKIILAKAQTFMNNSGIAVKSLVTSYPCLLTPGGKPVTSLFVIHDDIDIPLGKFKIQTSRSAAGHNGVQSIIDHLGTKDFTRIRIGILPDNIDKTKLDTTKFVLKKFNKQELDILYDTIFPAIITKIFS